MIVELNGRTREVGSARDALAAVGPHDEVLLVHRRADGAMLRACGDATSGFVIDVRGGHTGDRTSAGRSLRATTVATMFDRFAAGDTGWPGAVVWADERTATTGPKRSSALASFVLLAVAGVAAVATHIALRVLVTLPLVCGRVDRDLDRVQLRTSTFDGGDLCVFTDGAEVRVLDVAPVLGWVELIGSFLAIGGFYGLYSRALARAFRR